MTKEELLRSRLAYLGYKWVGVSVVWAVYGIFLWWCWLSAASWVVEIIWSENGAMNVVIENFWHLPVFSYLFWLVVLEWAVKTMSFATKELWKKWVDRIPRIEFAWKECLRVGLAEGAGSIKSKGRFDYGQRRLSYGAQVRVSALMFFGLFNAWVLLARKLSGVEAGVSGSWMDWLVLGFYCGLLSLIVAIGIQKVAKSVMERMKVDRMLSKIAEKERDRLEERRLKLDAYEKDHGGSILKREFNVVQVKKRRGVL